MLGMARVLLASRGVEESIDSLAGALHEAESLIRTRGPDQ